ncbi:hypothetical protein GCK32_022601, partial [Trichostrongylus colubriformis]
INLCADVLHRSTQRAQLPRTLSSNTFFLLCCSASLFLTYCLYFTHSMCNPSISYRKFPTTVSSKAHRELAREVGR